MIVWNRQVGQTAINQVTAEETYALAFFAAASVSPDSGDPVCIEPSVDAQKRQRLP